METAAILAIYFLPNLYNGRYAFVLDTKPVSLGSTDD